MVQFFQFYNTPEDQRVLISFFHLEGPTLSWFKWMQIVSVGLRLCDGDRENRG